MEEVKTNNGNVEASTKNRLTAIMLCWFLGFFGIHRMYAGKILTGFLMLYGTIASAVICAVSLPLGLAGLTCVGAGVVYDFVILALRRFKDCYGKEMTQDNVY